MKLAHISDIHLRGSSRHDEIRATTVDFIKQAKSCDVDHIIISGDIFHTKTAGITPESIDLLVWFFTELSTVAPVHVTLGNHDGVIHNLDKQDAISPIIKAINNPRIKLYKDSGIYSIDKNLDLSVYSIFDKDNWSKCVKTNKKFNAAVFHGPVAGSKTDLNWMLDAEASVEFFESHDIVLLGDIHKQQFLDYKDGIARMGYPGSFLQNDYGEGLERNWLLWDVDVANKTWTVDVKPLLNTKPFVTVQSDEIDTVSLKNGRYRIQCDGDLTVAEKSKIRSKIKSKLNPVDISFVVEQIEIQKENNKSISETSFIDPESILNFCQTHYKKLMSKNVKEILRIGIDSGMQNEEKISKGNIWTIDSIKFDNVLGFGTGNEIDFSNFSGLVGIFGKNKVGKSSVVGSILYSAFNVVDRGTNKNHSIINGNQSSCLSEMIVSSQTDHLKIVRQTVKTKQKDTLSSNTQLNLFDLKEGTDLTLDQRASTDSVIKSKLGSIDDFLMGSVSTQNRISKMLDESPQDRRKIFTRHIGLDVIERSYQSVQAEFNAIKSENKQLSSELASYNLDEIEKEISDTSTNIETLETNLVLLNDEHETLLLANKDVAVVQSNIRDANKKIVEFKNELTKIESQLRAKKESIEKEKAWLESNSSAQEKLDNITSILKEKEETNRSIAEMKNELKSIRETTVRTEKDKKTLSTVPCGDEYPSCPFIRDAYENVKSNKDVDAKLESLEKTLDECIQKNSDYASLKTERDELVTILGVIPTKEKIIQQASADVSELDSREKQVTSSLVEETQKLSSLSNIQVDDDVVEKMKSIKIKIDASKKEVTQLTLKKGQMYSKKQSCLELQKKLEILSAKYADYENASTILSKKGIQSKLLSENIQCVNDKIRKYMEPHFDFVAELEIDEKDGSTEIAIVCHNGDRRSLNLGSGMERTVGCLAIRAALHAVSVLPKSNFMIIDEGFGVLEGDNIQNCLAFLRDISKNFKFVLVISHTQEIKDFMDYSINVVKNDDGTSQVMYN